MRRACRVPCWGTAWRRGSALALWALGHGVHKLTRDGCGVGLRGRQPRRRTGWQQPARRAIPLSPSAALKAPPAPAVRRGHSWPSSRDRGSLSEQGHGPVRRRPPAAGSPRVPVAQNSQNKAGPWKQHQKQKQNEGERTSPELTEFGGTHVPRTGSDSDDDEEKVAMTLKPSGGRNWRPPGCRARTTRAALPCLLAGPEGEPRHPGRLLGEPKSRAGVEKP